MEYLLIGEKISISRTDGRVHTAVVDSKQDEVQSITVAWTEGSKMMGKEIPWSSIVALNPHLMERTQANDELLKVSETQVKEEMLSLSDLENIEIDLNLEEG